MRPIHFAALLLLGAIWGASFLFIGLAVVEFGPLPLMFLRVLTAGLILAVLAYLTRRKGKPGAVLRLRTNWRKYLTVGLLNSALPFTLIAFSELHLTVSLAAILNSTTPLFAALIAAMWSNEKLTKRKMGGILLGVSGVAVLTGAGPLEVNPELVIAVAASLLAACCYGAGTVYASKNMKGLPAIYASLAQLLGAAVILAPLAGLALPPALPSSTALSAFLALTLLSTSFAYLLYFFLLQNVGPTRTASVTFLVPVFGTLWGVIFRHEPFNLGMVLGMAIILTSVGLVTGLRLGKRHLVGSLRASKAGES
jgi:drug/metabolite transporter (DMT)-like permease